MRRGCGAMNAAQRKARSEHGLAPAPRCATPAPARGAAERRRSVEARVGAMNAAQRKARSELGLAPAPRCATPVPARGAAERRRGVEARVRGYERGAARGKERARARSGTSLRHTGACARRGRKAARRRGAGMEVGRHDAARATLGRPDDPGGRAISLRRRSRRDVDRSGPGLGEEGSHYEQSWCPLPPLAPPKREREFVVGRCTGGLGASPSLRWVGLRGSPPMSGQRDPLIA